jgi:hypothetical protein
MNANATMTLDTTQTQSSTVVETNLPKKSNRGRKPKNTIEKTKQQITETLAKQFTYETPNVVSSGIAQFTYETPNVVSSGTAQFTYETPNVVSSGIAQFTYETPNVVSPGIAQNANPEEPEIKLQTFHHNFSEAITERFTYFATLHRFDDRKTFKEAWQKWIQEEDVAADIQTEIQTLESNHYNGDILDKMFKSVRYYYRKKPIMPKAPATRKEYVALPAFVLDGMDKHIIETMLQHTDPHTTKCGISPAKAFDLYMKQPQQHQATTTDTNQQDQTIDVAKYKKTYKNRFFIASKNIRKISCKETA